MFLSVAEELERETPPPRPITYGESPDWIRRVLQLYTQTEERKWRRILRQAALGSRADIPLGYPNSAGGVGQPSSTSLPTVAQPAAAAADAVVSVPPSAGQTAPVQSVVPVQQTEQEETQMDLGRILGGAYDIARTYYGIRGMSQQAPIMQQAPVMGVQPVAYQPVDTYGVQPSPAFLPALPGMVMGAGSQAGRIGAAIAGLGLGLTAEEIASIATVSSKIKCRRRRRRLATHSDIKDLAALKAVLGSGKAFDTWIATRKM